MSDFDLYLGQIKLTNDNELNAIYEPIGKNAHDIADINSELDRIEGSETVSGSIRYLANEALDGLNAGDIAVADSEGAFDGTDVESVLGELFSYVSGTASVNHVTCTVDTDSQDFAAKYTFHQNARKIADLSVPNDIHVTGGEIAEHDGVKYLVLHTDSGDISINASSLVDYMTGGNTAEINLSVDSSTNTLYSSVKKIPAGKIEYEANVAVSDALDDLSENKADASDLTSDNIEHGSGTVKDALDANAGSIGGIRELIGDVSDIEEDTLVEYIQNCGDSAIDSLNSNVPSVTGNVLMGLDITAGRISGNTKTVLDAENIAYDSNSSVADKLDELQGSVDALDGKVGEIPATSTAQNLIEYTDSKISSIELTADNIIVEDVHNNFGLLHNVEDILVFLSNRQQMSNISDSVKIVPWSTGTDAEIVEMVNAADRGEIDLTDYWNIGDERTVHLSAINSAYDEPDQPAQDIVFVLVHSGDKTLSSPVSSGRGKCSFTVCVKDVLYEGLFVTENTSSESWENANLRRWLNDTFYNAIPVSIRPIFKQHHNITYDGGHIQDRYYEGNVLDTIDNFSIPSEIEVTGNQFGHEQESYTVEGVLWDDYKNYMQTHNYDLYKKYRNGVSVNYRTRTHGIHNTDYSTISPSQKKLIAENQNLARLISPCGCI